MDDWLYTKKLPTSFIAACGLVCKGDKVLLLRSKRRGWEFPGGVVNEREAVLDGLRREILEETGIIAKPVQFVGIYQNMAARKGYGPLEGMDLPPTVIFSFLCEYESGETRCSDESEEVGWFTKDEAREMVTQPSYKERLADMLAFDGGVHFCSYERKDRDELKCFKDERLGI